MERLIELTNDEKAKMLHELFPDEIRLFLGYVAKCCDDLKSQPEQFRNDWGVSNFSFELWEWLVEQTREIVVDFYERAANDSRFFAECLFFGIGDEFVTKCLLKYINTECNNRKFKLAVDMLFSPD